MSTHGNTGAATALPRRSVLAGAVGIALASVGASAQEGSDGDLYRNLETVIVEGQRAHDAELSSGKFTAPLLDTPKSITVVSADLIEERGATSLVEALRSVPGITFNAGEGGQPAGDNLKIRGFDAGADVFVDGIRDAGSQTRDIFALEQIEVVKGPGSAYSGRGSTGGSVNLVTKRPQMDNFVTTRFGAGTDEYLRGSIDANYRFGDSAALRFNVLGQDGDVPGRNEVFISHRGFAPSLALGLETPTRIHLDYYYYRTDDMPDYSMPYGRNATNTAPEGEPVDVDRENFYGLVNRDFQETGSDIRTFAIEHDIGERFTLRNTMRYGESTNDYIVTNPDDGRGNVPNGFLFRSSKSRNSETLTQANLTDVFGEARIGDTQHSFAVGLELSTEEMYNRNYAVEALFAGNAVTAFASSCSAPGAAGAASNYSCTTLANPDPRDPWSGAITAATSDTLADAETRSVYAFDTLTFGPAWSLNLGVRYDDYETLQLSGPIGAPTPLENQSDFWNHQIGVVYKPAANGSVYISSGTSSNPSGNTLGDGTENISAANAALEPERNSTYELGTKWDLFERRLALTTAVFHTEKENARVPVEPGNNGRQENVGTQIIDGFEVALVGNVAERWQLLASYTWLDSEIADDGPIATNEGNVFPNTPENSASLWATVAISPKFTLGAGASYVDQRFGSVTNTVWVPSYTIYDAMAALALGERMRLQLNVQNLTDEVYFTRPYQSHYAAIGPARSAVMTVSLDF